MSSPITAVLHIEVVHPDPEAAADFLCAVIGGERVERQMSAYLSSRNPEMHVVHVALGSVVIQIVKPPNADRHRSWHDQLTNQGPGVHDICFLVDDLEGVRQKMLDAGAVEAGAFIGMTLQDAGLPIEGTQDGYLIDAREQSGIRFELLEDMPWEPGKAP